MSWEESENIRRSVHENVITPEQPAQLKRVRAY